MRTQPNMICSAGERSQKGFTLIELVVVIVIMGILGAVLFIALQAPIKMWAGLAPRAELTAAAESALQRMTREIRLALPNSVRINAGLTTIEFLRVVDGGRYRLRPPGDRIDLSANTDTFDVLGGLVNSGSITAGGASSSDCINGNSDCLVIYNTGSPGAPPGIGGNSYNAYLGPGNPGSGIASTDFFGNIASVSSASAASIGFNNSDLGSWHFPTGSPQQRFYIVDTPVRFVCNTGAGEIRRLAEYNIEDNIANAITPTENNLLADHVTACNFSYAAASSLRYGLVTLRITLTSDDGQTVTLMQQAHVSNVP